MSKPSAGDKSHDLQIGDMSLPPWDRDGNGWQTNLSDRVGQHVAVGARSAAALLGLGKAMVRPFVKTGIVREAVIIERPADRTTHACVTSAYWTRFYLEYGERLQSLTFGSPASWLHDADQTDYDGRVCVRVRAREDGATDDLTIVTNKRTYNIRLVWNFQKVTLACSWTYKEPTPKHPRRKRLGLPGDLTGRWGARAMNRLSNFLLFRLGIDIRAQLMRWAAKLPVVKARQLRLYKRLHRHADVPAAWKHPRQIMEAVIVRARQVQSFALGELRQWVPIPNDYHATVDALKEMAGVDAVRFVSSGGVAPTLRELCVRFAFLKELPGTSLDDPDTFEEPPERARKVVTTMDAFADHGALFCAIAPRLVRRPLYIVQVLKELKMAEDLGVAASLSLTLGSPDAVTALIEHVLYSPQTERLSASTRYKIVRGLLLLIRLVRRYIRYCDHDGTRGLGRLRPADPMEFQGALKRVREFGKSLFVAYRENRKKHVFRHTGALAKLEFAADLNLEQVVLTTRALKAAEPDLGSADWIDVPVAMTIVDQTGRMHPGKQECIWRIWRASALFARLLKGCRNRDEQLRIQAYLDAIAAGKVIAPIHEYRRTVGLMGSTPIEPFLVRCWRHGLIALPSTLPARVQRARHAVLRDLKLPGFHGDMSGLLQGSTDEMDYWRSALRQNRTLAFLEPFEHALRFAHLAQVTVSETMCRTTAFVQQVQDQNGWETRRLNRQDVAGFLAHDKTTGELTDTKTWFPVGDRLLEEAAELVRMTCERCGYSDGLLPEIMHWNEIQWKCPEPAAWTFSFNGTVLSAANLLRYLRFLLPGHGRVSYHDFRHLLANAAHEAGMPGWMIRRALNHASDDLWHYYAKLDARQQAAFDASSIRMIIERSADAASRRLAA